MATEAYDTFEYIKPADYLPALQQGYQEIEEGFALAEEQARANDQMRITNAETMDRAINKAYSFSGKFAKVLEKQRDERDRVLRNDAKILARKSGATLQGLAEYNRRNKDKEKFNEETGYYYELAAQFDAKGQHEIASQLRNLTGRKGVIFKENLARTSALNWEPGFWESVNSIEITGKDGEVLTWAGAENRAERQEIINEYNRQSGLDDINNLSDEFLDEHFWNHVERAESNILGEAAKNKYEADIADEHASVKEQLIIAAKMSPKALAEKFLQTNRDYRGLYKGGQTGARKAQLEVLFKAVENGEIDASVLEALSQESFIPKGQDKPVTIAEYYKNEFGGEFDSRLIEAKKKKEQIYLNEQEATRNAFVRDLQQAKKDSPNGRLTEAQLKEAVQTWESDPTRGPVPQWLTNEFTNSLEDKQDDDIIDEQRWRMSKGYGLDLDKINLIQDETKRATWINNLQTIGDGLPKKIRDRNDQYLKSIVAEKLGETTGLTEKSPEYYRVLHRAEDFFQAMYEQELAKEGVTPSQAADTAMIATEKAVEADKFFGELELPETQHFSRKIGEVNKALATAKRAGNNNILMERIIPGTEKDAELLQDYFDKGKGNIPRIYKVIATELKYDSNGEPLTARKVAALQYEVLTGKKPKPSAYETYLNSLDKDTQFLRTWRVTSNRARRVEVIENKKKDDSSKGFNAEDLLNNDLFEQIWQK